MSDFKFALILALIVLGSIIVTDDMAYQAPEKIIKQRAIQSRKWNVRISNQDSQIVRSLVLGSIAYEYFQ
ncbi:MAG: hypothetical protein DA328_10085 [Nitrososphaeraceae archaeon]|nr:hypothetical protein [Nitrososphaeraceae archaeon]